MVTSSVGMAVGTGPAGTGPGQQAVESGSAAATSAAAPPAPRALVADARETLDGLGSVGPGNQPHPDRARTQYDRALADYRDPVHPRTESALNALKKGTDALHATLAKTRGRHSATETQRARIDNATRLAAAGANRTARLQLLDAERTFDAHAPNLDNGTRRALEARLDDAKRALARAESPTPKAAGNGKKAEGPKEKGKKATGKRRGKSAASKGNGGPGNGKQAKASAGNGTKGGGNGNRTGSPDARGGSGNGLVGTVEQRAKAINQYRVSWRHSTAVLDRIEESGVESTLADADGDGLSDPLEAGLGTNATNADSDGDSLSDFVETAEGFRIDTDQDGIIDALDHDSDGDSIADAFEGSDSRSRLRLTLTATGPNDTDGDDVLDFRDADDDGDAIATATEVSDGRNATDGHDVDLDRTPNWRDTDADGDGTSDSEEGQADGDGDGIPDYLDNDADNDLLPGFYEENVTGTAPDAADSDSTRTAADEAGDGAIDGFEDLDGDDLNSSGEYRIRTDPLDPDTDGDGLSDGFEFRYGPIDPLQIDADGDGTSDDQEDTDGDGLANVREEDAGSSPIANDTDGDRLDDRAEVEDHGTDPAATDTDGDGLTDFEELQLGTDPLATDSDGDGVPDGEETYTTERTDDDTGVTVTVNGSGALAEAVSVRQASENGTTSLGATATGDGGSRIDQDSVVRASPVVHLESEESFENATVEIPLGDGVSATGPQGENLTIVQWSTERGEPIRTVNTTVDPEGRVATATVENFSYFWVVDRAAWTDSRTATIGFDDLTILDEIGDLDDWQTSGNVTVEGALETRAVLRSGTFSETEEEDQQDDGSSGGDGGGGEDGGDDDGVTVGPGEDVSGPIDGPTGGPVDGTGGGGVTIGPGGDVSGPGDGDTGVSPAIDDSLPGRALAGARGTGAGAGRVRQSTFADRRPALRFAPSTETDVSESEMSRTFTVDSPDAAAVVVTLEAEIEDSSGSIVVEVGPSGGSKEVVFSEASPGTVSSTTATTALSKFSTNEIEVVVRASGDARASVEKVGVTDSADGDDLPDALERAVDGKVALEYKTIHDGSAVIRTRVLDLSTDPSTGADTDGDGLEDHEEVELVSWDENIFTGADHVWAVLALEIGGPDIEEAYSASGVRVEYGSDPGTANTDAVGLEDALESNKGSDPRVAEVMYTGVQFYTRLQRGEKRLKPYLLGEGDVRAADVERRADAIVGTAEVPLGGYFNPHDTREEDTKFCFPTPFGERCVIDDQPDWVTDSQVDYLPKYEYAKINGRVFVVGEGNVAGHLPRDFSVRLVDTDPQVDHLRAYTNPNSFPTILTHHSSDVDIIVEGDSLRTRQSQGRVRLGRIRYTVDLPEHSIFARGGGETITSGTPYSLGVNNTDKVAAVMDRTRTVFSKGMQLALGAGPAGSLAGSFEVKLVSGSTSIALNAFLLQELKGNADRLVDASGIRMETHLQEVKTVEANIPYVDREMEVIRTTVVLTRYN